MLCYSEQKTCVMRRLEQMYKYNMSFTMKANIINADLHICNNSVFNFFLNKVTDGALRILYGSLF